jgi:hypothetical protein
VKKAYAKVKAEVAKEEQEKRERSKALRSHQPVHTEDGAPPAQEGESGNDDAADGEGGEALHPTRQLMLKDEEAAQTGSGTGEHGSSDGHRRRTRRPGYYDKQLQKAEQRKAERAARAEEIQRRREERQRKIAEREKYKKAMAKTIGRDGKKKLGRESTLLLDKVKKMVAEK